MSSQRLRYHAFTLLELITTIAIIGIVAGFSFTSLQAARLRGRDSQRKADINLIAQGLDIYYAENRAFPTDSSGGCNFNSSQGTNWIPNLTAHYLVSTRQGQQPRDPLNTSLYRYTYLCSGSTGYTLTATLENSKDKEAVLIGGKPIYKLVR